MKLIAPFIFILSVVRFLSLSDLIDVSQGIVEGIVVEENYVELDGVLYTEVRLNVLRSFKGEFPDEITFFVKGGKKGDVVYKVSGEPVFTKGERVILFLTRMGGLWRIKGMSLGKFIVREKNGKKFVERDTGGLSVLKDGHIEKVEPFSMEYDEFITLIKNVVENR